MSKVFRVFPNDPIPESIERGEGLYLYTKAGKRYLDISAGSNSYAVLGWSHPEVLTAMKVQLEKFTHVDYKAWTDDNVSILADLLLSRAEHKLDKIYFCGNAGSEACEAAMKMSYQVHYDEDRPDKTWFISREQSYHGASTDAMAVGERPNLQFYSPLFPTNRAKIPQHHPKKMMLPGETLDEYARRSAKQLEDKILEIGPEKVAAFIGETIMGGLIGDVPPAPKYWQYIREVCNKYNVHLIMDEVYCGLGSSGKVYCCDWDSVTPDFLLLGKTLAAGYAPLSAVVTKNEFYEIIKRKQGRLQHTTTHQAYSLGVAAGIAVQKVIQSDGMLAHIQNMGEYMRRVIGEELNNHPFYYDIRGRGLRFSFEYQCKNQNEFGQMLQEWMKEKYNILINAKWHRVSFTPAFIITQAEVDKVLDCFIRTFKEVAEISQFNASFIKNSRENICQKIN